MDRQARVENIHWKTFCRALIEGQIATPFRNDITLTDIPLRGFKLVLGFVYTGQLQLGSLDNDAILEVLEIAHLYGLIKLQNAVVQHLQENLSTGNVFGIYSRAHSLQLDRLREACNAFVVDNHRVALHSEAFRDVPQAVLCHMLSQDSFCVREIDIFNAVVRWCAHQPAGGDHSNVLKFIRFPLIDTTDLMTTVKNSGLVSTELLLHAMETRSCRSSKMKFRGTLKSGVNLADSAFGALRLKPKTRGNYESSETRLNYDKKPLEPYPAMIKFSTATGLTIALDKAYLINHIAFTFCDVELQCAYYVEFSLDLEDWARTPHCTNSSRSPKEQLFFESRVVRYIRLMTTATNSKERRIGLSTLEVTHTTKPREAKRVVSVPLENVASAALGAFMIENPRGGDGLIRKQATDGSEGPMWTSHEIGKGSITISLRQIFKVDSMQMLLRSDGERAYKYYVEVSANWIEWTRVADHTESFCNFMQTIVFRARDVRFIRIVGTAATVGNVSLLFISLQLIVSAFILSPNLPKID